MYEGEPNEDDDKQPPIFIAEVGDDGGLRGEWMDTAEYIAETEKQIALWFRNPLSRSSPVRDGRDHCQPGFLYLGERESLAFIADMAAGIIKHGEAFAFWVREMGNSPDALPMFEKVFLGQWESAEQFAQHVLDDLGCSEDSQRRDSQELRQDPQMDAKTWARELQRRGEINVIANPQGGVWVFRGW